MTKKSWNAIYSGLGIGAGTLLYTRFLSNAHQYDWERAIFVGAFSAVVLLVVANVSSK